jgi:hypothetical protein
MKASELEVVEANLRDVFSDVARLHIDHRPFARAGQIIVIICGDKTAYAVARGPANIKKNQIALDSSTREKLCVKPCQKLNFVIKRASWIDEFRWAWGVTDAMPRVAARLGVVSLILGLIGLVLGALSLWPTIKEACCE